jgi:hypothetical protein
VEDWGSFDNYFVRLIILRKGITIRAALFISPYTLLIVFLIPCLVSSISLNRTDFQTSIVACTLILLFLVSSCKRGSFPFLLCVRSKTVSGLSSFIDPAGSVIVEARLNVCTHFHFCLIGEEAALGVWVGFVIAGKFGVEGKLGRSLSPAVSL